jgi:hypothetical protein
MQLCVLQGLLWLLVHFSIIRRKRPDAGWACKWQRMGRALLGLLLEKLDSLRLASPGCRTHTPQSPRALWVSSGAHCKQLRVSARQRTAGEVHRITNCDFIRGFSRLIGQPGSDSGKHCSEFAVLRQPARHAGLKVRLAGLRIVHVQAIMPLLGTGVLVFTHVFPHHMMRTACCGNDSVSAGCPNMRCCNW